MHVLEKSLRSGVPFHPDRAELAVPPELVWQMFHGLVVLVPRVTAEQHGALPHLHLVVHTQ